MADPRGFLTKQRAGAPTRPVHERLGDWREVYVEGGLLPIISEQAGRCMDCGIPFCHQGCPLGNLIPEWNDLVWREDWQVAAERLHATNNFPEFTGRLCPAPCEAACVLAIGDDPVTIKNVEVSIIDRAFQEGWVEPQPPSRLTDQTVAVVGSGPAGLAAAQQLTRAGHTVAVYERADRAGGLLRYGIPEFKMEKRHLDRRLDQMRAEGTIFRTGVDAGDTVTGQELRRRYDAVVLAVGATAWRDLQVPGRELRGIHQAMEYLPQANRTSLGETVPDQITAEGKDVVIIGGGDTGADCLGTVHRQGARSVTQLEIMPEPPASRHDSTPWPTWPLMLRTSAAHEEGGTRKYSVSTQEFVSDGSGAVRALRLVEVRRGESGFEPVPGTEWELEADLVLLALGFVGPERSALVEQLNLDLDERGNIARDGSYATSVPGVFAAGDAGRGQSLIVWAIAEGRSCAAAVDRYLTGDDRLPAHPLHVINGDHRGGGGGLRRIQERQAALDWSNVRRAKIVCTLGPASNSAERLRELVEAGMDVARLNMSHGSHEEHEERYRRVRAAAAVAGRNVGVLADLQGPKIRLGTFGDGQVQLEAGEQFTITTDEITGDSTRTSTTHSGLPGDVHPGDTVLIDDGRLSLEVKEVSGSNVVTRVLQGGAVSDHKGLNLPGTRVNVPAMSERDVEDLRWALRVGVDMVALSFVRAASDVTEVHRVMDSEGITVPVIAKIEKPQAVENLEEIVDAFDGIMVARGDLGVELPLWDVPLVQKQAVELARRRAKPVIVATQMLESMVGSPRPTRAEASDVANAVLDGADAVMLSGETSVGDYPVEAVSTMARIVETVEVNGIERIPPLGTRPRTKGGAITRAAIEVADVLGAKYLVAFTQTGDSAMRMSRLRSPIPLLAFTPLEATRNRLALSWGIEAFLVPQVSHTDAMVLQVDRMLLEMSRCRRGDLVVIVAGSPPGIPGSTNAMRVHRIGDAVGQVAPGYR